MKILFLNHQKTQCGVYEIGLRIHTLLHEVGLISSYREVNGEIQYHQVLEEEKPDLIIYNYVGVTMPFLTPYLIGTYPYIYHIGIIHDSFNYIPEVEELFDRWIVHDLTNTTPSKKKFLTVRPIRRFNRVEQNTDEISIGTHGFPISPWKMYDVIAEWVNYNFDNVSLNMNLPIASFGGTMEQAQSVADLCKSKITKPGIKLNISHHYFDTELDLIEHLSKNTMNVYFYNDTVYNNLGVAGSADLAVASQSSLAINGAYMYRHFHDKLGICTMENMKEFINNKNRVKEIYEEWSPERMKQDYIKMIETL